MSAETPELAHVGEPPALYARWWRDVAGASDDAIGSAWRMTFPADRKFWTELDAELAALATLERDEQPIRKISYPLSDDEIQALREQGIIGDDGKTMMDRLVEQAFTDARFSAETQPAPEPPSLEATIEAVGPDTAIGGLLSHVAGTDECAPQPAPELRDAWEAARLIREQHGRLLDRFGKSSDGYRARLSGVILAREYRDAGLPVPERLSHLRGHL